MQQTCRGGGGHTPSQAPRWSMRAQRTRQSTRQRAQLRRDDVLGGETTCASSEDGGSLLIHHAGDDGDDGYGGRRGAIVQQVRTRQP
jgi:hypothetical protein